MKILVFSDIHGCASACEKALNQYVSRNCDMMLILGDILYHGPRNNIPENYDPKAVVSMLNPLADNIMACRGNCDAEVDQMLLEFPVMADYVLLCDNGKKVFATHGHVYSPLKSDGSGCVVNGSTLPRLSGIDVMLYGHTHIQELRNQYGITICNPGSISIPKNGQKPGYAVWDNGNLEVYNF